MPAYAKILLKLLATLLASAIAFFVAMFAGNIYCDRWLVPAWMKQYPHDGQLGLGVFVFAFLWGLAGGGLVLIAGIVWTVKTSRRKKATSTGA